MLIFCAREVLGHDSIVGTFNSFSINAITVGCVTIIDNNILRAGSIVKEGVEIGNSVLVGAGACGFNNIPSHSVVASPRSYIIPQKNSREYY